MICPKNPRFPLYAFSGDGIEIINPTRSAGVWILRENMSSHQISDVEVPKELKYLSFPQGVPRKTS